MEPLNKKTRFDLEQEILDCWNVTKDIDDFYHAQQSLSQDEQMNYLLGLKQIYEVKFEKLWNTFEECVKNKQV